jgi:molecular chaperone IbpA
MKYPTIAYPDFSKVMQSFVGFEKLFEDMNQSIVNQKWLPNFPAYNIKVENDNKYVIELAVAGFGKSDLEVELDGSILRVKGRVESSTDKTSDYLYKGLTEKSFVREFNLADQVEVKNAELINGVLKIWLEGIRKLPNIVKIPVESK